MGKGGGDLSSCDIVMTAGGGWGRGDGFKFLSDTIMPSEGGGEWGRG